MRSEKGQKTGEKMDRIIIYRLSKTKSPQEHMYPCKIE